MAVLALCRHYSALEMYCASAEYNLIVVYRILYYIASDENYYFTSALAPL